MRPRSESQMAATAVCWITKDTMDEAGVRGRKDSGWTQPFVDYSSTKARNGPEDQQKKQDAGLPARGGDGGSPVNKGNRLGGNQGGSRVAGSQGFMMDSAVRRLFMNEGSKWTIIQQRRLEMDHYS